MQRVEETVDANPVSQLVPNPLTSVQKILDHAKSVRTPIQLTSFVIAVVFAIVLLRANIATEVLEFTILLLPFILLILLFNGTTLDRISRGGHPLLIIAVLIILGSFIPSGFVALTLISTSQGGLAHAPQNSFAGPARKRKAEEIRNDNARVQSYFESYNLTSKYYRSALLDTFGTASHPDSYSTVVSLRNDMNDLTAKILSVRGTALNDIYGSNDTKLEVLKLQKCQMDLESTKYLWEVVLIIYGSDGETKSLDQIIDVKTLTFDKDFQSGIKQIRYSRVEADLIQALGVSVVTKPVNGFQVEDVDNIRRAFGSLGYLSDSSNGQSSAELLRRFNISIGNYLTDVQQSQPMYKLAFEGLPTQIAVYLSLYDTGLLDFRKFMLKYSPDNARPILLDLMNSEISLVSTEDVDKFSRDILQQEATAQIAPGTPDVILFKIRDEFKDTVGNSVQAQDVLASKTAEEYFIRTLKMAINKNSNPQERNMFGGISGFGQQPSGHYREVVGELLSYYDVFEANLVAGALGD
jgi:hypothetical protein